MTIVGFLLARIAEDEAAATAATPGPWRPGMLGIGSGNEQVACWDECRQVRSDSVAGNIAHIARYDPARVLAECEAKRRIVELLTEADPALGEWESDGANTAYDACMILAAVYVDHADYDQAWKI